MKNGEVRTRATLAHPMRAWIASATSHREPVAANDRAELEHIPSLSGSAELHGMEEDWELDSRSPVQIRTRD
jgi:hypothetical protein